MRVLIVGRGQLGTCLERHAWNAQTQVELIGRPEVDLTVPRTLEESIRRHPADVVVCTAAYTRVDDAEDDPDVARAANALGPGLLAELTASRGATFIWFSTDYVFDGRLRRPYLEEDPLCPLGVYGVTKAEGEARVRQVQPRHLIFRTSWLYSDVGNNFVRTMVRLARERDELQVVADQTGSPTSALELASAVESVCVRIAQGEELAYGTYHCSGLGDATWHALAEHIMDCQASHTGRRPVVKPIHLRDRPARAQRPLYSVLDTTLARDVLGLRFKPWREGVSRVVGQIFEQGGADL